MNLITISFDPAHYTVMENVGQFAVTICRDGDLSQTVCVDFKTEDGTANAGGDYEGVEETLIFRPGETHKQVSVTRDAHLKVLSAIELGARRQEGWTDS